MNKVEIAAQAHAAGRNCAQSVICAFLPELNMDEKTAFRLFEGFGGGVGGMQEICGALSAAAAVISYALSNGEIDPANKQRVYSTIQTAGQRFQEKMGSVTCRDIKAGQSGRTPSCGEAVAAATRITEEILKEL